MKLDLINSKWISALNVKSETNEKLNTDLDKYFFGIWCPQSNANKAKIDKWDYETKGFLHSKRNSQKCKNITYRTGEKYLQAIHDRISTQNV